MEHEIMHIEETWAKLEKILKDEPKENMMVYICTMIDMAHDKSNETYEEILQAIQEAVIYVNEIFNCFKMEMEVNTVNEN